ncbi:MAG: hypothetical protein AAGU21_15685 [Solidesulfovibrio sp.]|uniref:hypothetical protein n=1 Tax=Solidesulfovibrio sp. TaxID=2910990 RepID=UPI0031586D6C
MNVTYVFEFESANAIVALDVVEDENGSISHTVRSITPKQKRQSDVNISCFGESKDFIAYLFHPELVNCKKPIAIINGFDFSICNEQELNRFIFKLLYHVEMSQEYEIHDLRDFAQFAELMDQ